ncbi:hypothetical protein [Microbacterium sp. K24]|uniref:hypothetical protein n=1 Tax=Microbacterium sp. K24 TaxID=2305446 RepID=UPI0014445808|nr:hypothetical protein [Microbacterium sp. K24]
MTPDTLPLWFWLPAFLVLAPLALFAMTIKVSSTEDPYPDESTPLDILEQTGIYPR